MARQITGHPRRARGRATPENILVAGAAGFIGSHLTERLLAEGHSVIGVDNLVTGNAANVAPLIANPKFRFQVHDVIRPLRVAERLTWVIHLASPASPPAYMRDGLQTLRCNAEGTYHLLELARRSGAQFLLASTSEVYGDPQVHPQEENYWGNVNPVGPRSVYDEAKRYAEALVTEYRRRYGLRSRIIRIFNTYGPRMQLGDGRVVSNFVVQALSGLPLSIYGTGEQTRSFQFIDDLVEGILRVMRASYYDPVNLGNPSEFRVLDLAQMVTRLAKSRSTIEFRPLPEDDPRQRRPDITLARKLLEWEPRVALEEGLTKTIRYFRDLVAPAEVEGGPTALKLRTVSSVA